MPESNEQPELIGRRSALKKAAAAGAAAGLVWSAPKVEGLTLRPNYAAAQSTLLPCVSIGPPLVIEFDPTEGFSTQGSICPGGQGFPGYDFIWRPFSGALTLTVRTTAPGAADPALADVTPATFLDGLNGTNVSGTGFQFSEQGLSLPATGNVRINVPYNCA